MWTTVLLPALMKRGKGERERVNCRAAKKEELVIGWEWFQMVEQSMKTPRVPASWPTCFLQAPLRHTHTVQWTTVDKRSRHNEKFKRQYSAYGISFNWFWLVLIGFLPTTTPTVGSWYWMDGSFICPYCVKRTFRQTWISLKLLSDLAHVQYVTQNTI